MLEMTRRKSVGEEEPRLEGAPLVLRVASTCLCLLVLVFAVACQDVGTGGSACDDSELPAAGVSVSTDHLRFYFQLVGTKSVERTVIVTAGTEALIVDRLEVDLEEFEVETEEPLPASVAPGDTLDIHVTYTPLVAGALPLDWAAEPESDASLAIHVDGCAVPATVRLSGTGHDQAGEGVMNVDPLEIEFGSQPVGEESQPRSLFIWSGSDQPIQISAVDVPDQKPDVPSPFSTPSLDAPIELAPATGREFLITFTPLEEGDVEGSFWCETTTELDEGTSVVATSAYPLRGTGI